MNLSQPSTPTPAALDLDQGEVRPDQALARAAQRALDEHFEQVKAGRLKPSLSREVFDALPRGSEPQLEASGYWKLGAWMLESRSGALALTYRPMQPEPRYEFVAALRRNAGAFEVATLTMRQLHPRR